MTCDGPDPPENNPYEISARPRQDIEVAHIDESDEEVEHFGYEPLPQGPDAVHSDQEHDDDDDDDDPNESFVPPTDIPTIEPMDTILTREVWNTPRPLDPIRMDNERAAQVMSAMANFALPMTSIPEWAQSISEDQWKQTLTDRIEKLKSNA